MNEKISVIIPCYNQAQFLPETLDSILAQTYPYWEAIIVNDESPDSTEEIALDYCQKDSRFRYFKKTNGGPASARNYGIAQAQGKFILPLDSDDLLEPSYMEKGIKVFQQHPEYTLVYSWVRLFGLKKGIWSLTHYKDYRTLLKLNSIVCTSLFRKEDCLKAGGYDENLKQGNEDWEFYIRLLEGDKKVFQIQEDLFLYRIRNNTLTATTQANIDSIYDYIYQKHTDKYIRYWGNPISLLNKYEFYQRKYNTHHNKWYRKCFRTIKQSLRRKNNP